MEILELKNDDYKLLKYIAEGSDIKAYKYGNLAIKLYHDLNMLNTEEIDRLEFVSKVDIDGLAKTKYLVLIEGILKGFACDYVDGIHFSNLMLDYSYETVLRFLKMARAILDRVHEKGLVMGDIKSANILFNFPHNIVSFVDTKDFIRDSKKFRFSSDYTIRFNEADILSDIYSFNILTISVLEKICECFIRRHLFDKELYRDFELGKIIEWMKTFRSNGFEGKYIIDYLPDNLKEYQRIKRRHI